MTKQTDILTDTKYIPCLDHGFVGLVDSMGSDSAIVQAARVSYGAGTKTVNEDRGLIRYLIRHRHTSPIEMAEVKLHIKLPIFVMRQLVRHRTSSLNEYSGRYSVMSDEFYMPDMDKLMPQSTTNKQGRDGVISEVHKKLMMDVIAGQYEGAYRVYQGLIDTDEDSAFPGLAREMARIVLPVANYTECYWKQNLHNLLHLLKLRRDEHAQEEIRVYAEAIYQLVKPLFPLACEAWEDYVWNGLTLSRMERTALADIIALGKHEFQNRLDNAGEESMARHYGMSRREFVEFRKAWQV